jgi:amino acid transporter
MPFAHVFARVSKKHGTPGPAIWLIAGTSLAVMAWSGAVPIVTSLSTVALYVAYIVPIILGARARGRSPSWTSEARWNVGRWGYPVNIIAIGYTLFISVTLVMPPNALAGKTLAAVVSALVVLYWVRVRPRFSGPALSAGGNVVQAVTPSK